MTSSQGNNAIPKAFLKSRLALLIIVISVLGYNHEYLEFYFYYRSQCLASAIDIGGGEKLALCGRKVLDSLPDAPDIRAFVYDTSDQLLLPEDKRSAKWQEIAGKIGLRAAFISQDTVTKKQKFIVKDNYGNVIFLGGHFYRVTF